MISNIFELETRLSKALEQDAERALQKLPSTSVVFSHLCHGLQHTLGALRLTRIWPRSTYASLLSEVIGGDSKEYAKLFSRHIRRVGREGALLDFLMRYLLKTSALRDGLDHGLKAASLTFSRTTSAGAPFTYDKNLHLVALSDAFYSTLIPPDLTESYWRALAEDDIHEGVRDDWKLRMMAAKLHSARGKALAMLEEKEDVKGLEHAKELAGYYTVPLLDDEMPHWTSDADAQLWYLLGALQTSYMLVHMHGRKDTPLAGFVSSGIIYTSEEAADATLSHCVGIMTASLSAQEDGPQAMKTLEEIQRTQAVNHAVRVRHAIDDVNFEETAPQIESVRRVVEEKFEGLAQAALVPEWPPRVAHWLTNIIQWLRGSVHEGQSLNFCAVLGDYSQICDSGLFNVLTIEANEHSRLPSPWDKNGKFRKNATRDIERLVRQQMAKSNYSWFQEGRYALLWDASLPTREPRALLALKSSSWDVFINECRVSRMPETKDHAAMVVYVKSDGTGGVIFRGEQIVTFRRNTPWQVGQPQLADWVSKQIQKYVAWLNPDGMTDDAERTRASSVLATIVGASLALSYDPHMGAMLVFMKEPIDRLPFEGMGSLWNIRERKDDLSAFDISELVALMAMDGATCLYVDRNRSPRVAFGQLVGGQSESAKLRWSANWDRVLRGEGSRKWNGAMTALRDDVCLVLAISQDGPIYRAGPFEEDAACEEGRPEDPTQYVQIQVSTEVMQKLYGGLGGTYL